MSTPTQVEKLRWWFERWVVQAALLARHIRSPIRISIDYSLQSPFGRRVLDDWYQREFVRTYIYKYEMTDEERAELDDFEGDLE